MNDADHTPAPAPVDASTGDPDEESFRPLPDAALRSARLGGLIRALLLGGGSGLALGIALGATQDPGIAARLLLVAGGAIFWAVASWFWQGVAHRHISYRIDDDGWHVRRGVFWRSQTLVPRSRVQHVDLNHGPIDRHFGLASLKVHTAGTRMEAVTLHGLLADDAVALRDALLSHDDDAV